MIASLDFPQRYFVQRFAAALLKQRRLHDDTHRSMHVSNEFFVPFWIRNSYKGRYEPSPSADICYDCRCGGRRARGRPFEPDSAYGLAPDSRLGKRIGCTVV